MIENGNRLNSKKNGYSTIENGNDNGNYHGNGKSNGKNNGITVGGLLPDMRISRFRKVILVAFVSIAMLVVFVAPNIPSQPQRKCKFCDQALPQLHHDRSYTLHLTSSKSSTVGETHSNTATVIPMTISYDYELSDGELLYTKSTDEVIPNLDFDYAILGVTSARNLHRATGTQVSLDEVYVHHFSTFPLNMVGAEVLTRDETTDPIMVFPEGYALHVIAKSVPFIGTNAHLLSNKNLQPIDGSLPRAHKECNECYYAPGKGSDCTPEASGTFACCGDSPACVEGKEDCFCATTTTQPQDSNQPALTKTKYRFEIDLLISRDIEKFQRIDQWNFAAPACAINLHGEAVLQKYPSNSFCGRRKKMLQQQQHGGSVAAPLALYFGGGSAFHHVPQDDDHPYLHTKIHIMAPTSGKILFAQSHLHTGGINATLSKNGERICATSAEYGTNADESTNARNEKNHLIKMSSCYNQIGPEGISFAYGDVFTTESYYYGGTDDDRMEGEGAAGGHQNAMSMFGVGVVFDGDSDYLTAERTSFNLWNDFVPVAGLGFKNNDAPDDRSKQGNLGF